MTSCYNGKPRRVHAHIHTCPRFAVAVLGVALFAEQAPDNFLEFDRAFVTMFRIAGSYDVLIVFGSWAWALSSCKLWLGADSGFYP